MNLNQYFLEKKLTLDLILIHQSRQWDESGLPPQ